LPSCEFSVKSGADEPGAGAGADDLAFKKEAIARVPITAVPMRTIEIMAGLYA